MRIFIAIDVSDEVKGKVGKLQSELSTGGLVFVKREAMHITLQFLGEKSAEEVEMVKKALSSIKFSRFRVSFVGLSYFSPDQIKVVFAKVEEGDGNLRGIYTKINNALLANGVGFPKENYVPHLTVARVKRAGNKKTLLDQIESNSSRDLGSFEVRSISLKESVLTPDGPEYKDLYKLDF